MSMRLVSIPSILALLAVTMGGCAPSLDFAKHYRREAGRVAEDLITPPRNRASSEPSFNPGQSAPNERPTPDSLQQSANEASVGFDMYGGGEEQESPSECGVITCVDDAGVESDCAGLSYGELKEDCFTICENGRVRGEIPATVSCSAECNVSLETLRLKCRAFVEYVADKKGVPFCSRIIPCR